MTMLGFTAAASLPKTREPYRMLGTLNPSATHGEVVPQGDWCTLVCNYYPDLTTFCWRECRPILYSSPSSQLSNEAR